MSGLILGLAAAGNLYLSNGWRGAWLLAQGLAATLWLLVILKFLVVPRSAFAGFKDPVVASIMPNLTMATMIIAWSLRQLGAPLPLAGTLWGLAVGCQYAMMASFITQHVLRAEKRLAMVLPSWFVLFVGIGVIPVTCAPFAPALGVPTTWLALGLYALVFPFVITRLVRVPLAKPALPLTTIL